MTKVAVIGAGPAGLVAAKECLERGLDVSVFEKSDQLGGLWNADTGHVWQGMKTNLSRDTCRFPDFDYQRSTDTFPGQADIVEYLSDYADHFSLQEKTDIRFGHTVKTVKRVQDKWSVEVSGQSHSFDAVVVASGFFTQPFIPLYSGGDHFQGEICHSSSLKNFENYRGKKVEIIGNGFSGCDLAVGFAAAGAEVTHRFRRPYWIVPRQHDGSAIDAMFFQYPDGTETKTLDLAEKFREKNEGLAELCHRQMKAHPLLAKDSDSAEPPHVAITDGYLEAVENGTVKLSLIENLNLGENQSDLIIFATGFQTNLSFLDEDVLRMLDYDPQDQFMPALISQSGQHHELEDMFFVGMYRGPYFLTMALQAQIAARTIAGESLMSRLDLGLDIEQAKDLRRERPRQQFPYGDYVDHSLRLARKLGINPQQEGRFLPEHFAFKG